MTQAEALDKLIAAVEAGELRGDFMPWIDPMDRTRGIMPYKFVAMPAAYNGSLDAAKALHEVLLPGWDYLISRHDAEMWQAGCYPDTIAAQIEGNPARAWLLATLKAYRAGL
jgi:hypothetical protein